MNDIPRCLMMFENSCKSRHSFRTYKTYVDDFLKWAHKDYESLLLLSNIELEELLQDYCIFKKKRVNSGEISPNSIPSYFNGIFKFLKVNRKSIDKNLIIELFPDKIKLGGERAITTKECQILLNSTGSKRDKAIIHVFCATGARPEAVCELQLKHIEPFKEDYWKVLLYAGDYKHEMTTFLHPEAVKALSEYFEWRKSKGERLTSESYVFRVKSYNSQNIKSKPFVPSTLSFQMSQIWKKSGIVRNKNGRRYDLATFTSFRKRFDTILEMNPEVSIGATQYLLDHTGYLSQNYRKPTIEQIFDSYKKSSLELMISDEMRLKLEQKLKEENTIKKESEKDMLIQKLETRLENTEKMLLEISKRIS